jgi:hypothetical protein
MGATLLSQTLNNLVHQDFGFTVEDRVVVSIARPLAEYDWPRLAELYRRLEDRLTCLPGANRALAGLATLFAPRGGTVANVCVAC